MAETTSEATAQRPERSAIDRYFKITERGSTFGREIRGGVVTFFAMAYIVVLNPLIIGTVADSTGRYIGGGTEPNLAAVAATTALVAGVVSILMGAIARFPLALAAGLGLNAFVAYGIASQMTWADAMGLVVLEGLIILVLVLTGFRRAVFYAVPRELKIAISVGIGLFIALVGMVNAGFVSRTEVGPVPVEFGTDGSLHGWPILVFVLGLLAIIVMLVRGVKGAILYGMLGATLMAIVIEAIAKVGPLVGADGEVANPNGWQLNVPGVPSEWIKLPDFSIIGEFSLLGSVERVGLVAALLFVFTLMLADFFDTMGTMTAVGAEAGLLDAEGTPPASQQILAVDAVGTIAGGVGSVSSNTSYIESATGVGDGARTGLSAIVTGVCFLLATAFAPLVEVIPYEAATPALVVVGFLMMAQAKNIPWDKIEIALPAFLTIALMPFSYSITVGIGAGFVSYIVIQVARGRARQVHPLLWIVGVLFVAYFAIDPIEQLLGVR